MKNGLKGLQVEAQRPKHTIAVTKCVSELYMYYAFSNGPESVMERVLFLFPRKAGLDLI